MRLEVLKECICSALLLHELISDPGFFSEEFLQDGIRVGQSRIVNHGMDQHGHRDINVQQKANSGFEASPGTVGKDGVDVTGPVERLSQDPHVNIQVTFLNGVKSNKGNYSMPFSFSIRDQSGGSHFFLFIKTMPCLRSYA